ncbi:MAG: 16S rRNA (adenine(1518)-N(6)/adenine(1519)-N(6))-dimethyltransferase RsmA [Gammaproteobacteria bacterium]|nr:16S rRNA (adenine(1518)-N(6)/adenine(1519)-N(6))-dimethyltransferase RsmA [Gammaproteobacteria bacterium]
MSHTPRKRFGQNFLHDPGVIQHIVHAINPHAGQSIIEIGPGQGAITRPLLQRCKQLTVIELDRDLIAGLETLNDDIHQLRIYNQDALKTDFCDLREEEQRLRIIGNLPYNISTPLLFHLLQQAHCIKDMHFMLQKEVVDRMVASAGSKTYGRLSVMLQYYCKVEHLFAIGPGAFNPPPRVNSAFVRLIPHSKAPVDVNITILEQVVRTAFSQRRKTLRNTLKSLLNSEQIQTTGIDPGIRAEQLSLQQFAQLANLVENNAT